MTDERHRRAMDLVAEAEELIREGVHEAARDKLLEAAELEQACADEADEARPRTRGVLRVSAVSVWLRADRLDEAEALARRYLAEPIEPGFARELHGLLKEVGIRRVREAALPREPDERADALLEELRALEPAVVRGRVPLSRVRNVA